ncbi:MFS transporter [Cellulomonas cellasea]|uniref:Transporter n=2 Tax=Cellulomonas cellasea TaxID=43670 RepID=A0A0A0B8U9_9CELL|nr:MFS transporter [Cellulomonas cellasea]KGM02229.1 transporter [Cellulomonas cellasea DSM 20118]GEA88514.1 MFS transporter [Cellulomonas cellasea]
MSSTARRTPAFLDRRSLAGVYLPALVFQVGLGAAVPMVAVTASQRGASLALAGLLAAMVGVGQILGDVPAGWLASRVGDRRAMLVASGVAAFTLTGAALSRDLLVLAVSVLGTGATASVYQLARQSYLTEITPVETRARALSTLGGVSRIGSFLGPFAGALAVHLGGTSAAFGLAVATTLLAGAVVLAVPDAAGAETVRRRTAARVPVRAVLREHRRVLTSLGVAVLLVGAVRGARQVVLPLWSEHLGLAPATTSLVFGLSGAVDMLLFYPAGHVMDRRGRLWIAVPSMLVLGVALPLAGTLPALAVAAMALGLGNGIGSGLLMTLGADVAPPAARSQFLGAWRLLQDSGVAAGPLVVAGGAALGSLALGVAATGGLALLAAVALGVTVPRWSPHANRRTREAAGLARDGTLA